MSTNAKNSPEALIKMLKLQSLSLEETDMKLKDWLEMVRLSIQDLAKVLGISRGYVYMLMDGEKKASALLMNKIADISMGKVKHIRNDSKQ